MSNDGDCFIYLGSVMSNDGDCSINIKNRLGKTREGERV